MSSSAAVRTARAARPAPSPGPRHPQRAVPASRTAQRSTGQPRLRVVTAARHTHSRAGLVVICVAALVLGLVGLLLLDVSLERGTYELRDQTSRADQLREQAQKIRTEIVAQEAPQNLEENARKLGMVPAPGAPVWVLPNGKTIGVPQRAVASPSPSVTTRPSASAPATTATKAPAPATTATKAAAPATTRTSAPMPTPAKSRRGAPSAGPTPGGARH